MPNTLYSKPPFASLKGPDFTLWWVVGGGGQACVNLVLKLNESMAVFFMVRLPNGSLGRCFIFQSNLLMISCVIMPIFFTFDITGKLNYHPEPLQVN